MHIATAVNTDIAGIQILAERVYRQEHTATDEAHIQRYLQRVFAPESLARAIGSASAFLLVAHEGTTVVGMCHYGSPLLEDCQERKEIYRLYVLPEYQRQGIGGQLLKHSLKQLRQMGGITEFVVYVPASETARIAFYQKYGFQHVADRDHEGDWCLLKKV
jgi:ribosomal protein S18 acetylase RimI-like enzyme